MESVYLDTVGHDAALRITSSEINKKLRKELKYDCIPGQH